MGRNIGELLARACERYSARPALARRGEVRTYGELLERGARVANALRGAGLAPGTPVAAMLEDRIASLEVYAGAFFGGYPVIHVNDRLAAPEVAHILADSGARALFHTDGRSEVVARISSYGRCAVTGTLSFVSGIWGVLLPHLYTGGTITFLHPYTPESWADQVEADRSTFTYAPTPFIPAFADQMRRRPQALRSVESVIHSGSPVPRAQVADLVDVIGERYIEVWGMTEGVAPFSATTRSDWRGEGGAKDVLASRAARRAVRRSGGERGGRPGGGGARGARRVMTLRPGSLAGRVAVVSGGGRGLGRAFCLALARQSVSVVVNNRNRLVDGDGLGPADHVVAEITALGGSAVAEMTAEGIPAALRERMTPEAVAPVLTALASEECELNGEYIVTGGGLLRRASAVEWETVRLPDGDVLSAGELAALLAESGKGEPREFGMSVDAFTDLALGGGRAG